MRAFRIAYDGRPFRGFQRQPDVPTVEDALLDALVELEVLEPRDDPGSRRTPPGYAAAGRTDAGVSALAQTVALEGPDWLTPRALNAALPDTVRAWASADVQGGFHATHDAAERSYRYFLYAPRESHAASDTGGDPAGRAFGDDRAREAIGRLAGRHDFRDLTPDDAGTERDLSLSATRDGRFLVVDATAGGFPRGLVRRLVTLVRDVASGARPVEFVDRALSPEPLSGPEGIGPASPEPLVLRRVEYPGVAFERDPDAAAAARRAFARRRREGATLDRVAGLVADGVDRG